MYDPGSKIKRQVRWTMYRESVSPLSGERPPVSVGTLLHWRSTCFTGNQCFHDKTPADRPVTNVSVGGGRPGWVFGGSGFPVHHGIVISVKAGLSQTLSGRH
ncbi:hypothetical protein BaRGS_00033297 [Batillaria attramentaria]|uniref:Uncharacterized protein n=1 Tax=Batillaria attramentaria TaxID=370345 RepID=A0ABD0JKF3_9CAEN